MPISYGQVKGYRYDNQQPVYDPDNPKRSRYQGKAVRVVSSPKVLTHGNSGYDRGCRCDVCRKAHSETQRVYRERSKGVQRRCQACGRWFRPENGESLCGECR